MLDPEKNFFPKDTKQIYMMGICGAGMSALAGILKYMGFEVKGSDSNPYPPMSDLLSRLKIPVFKGYSISNLKDTPDLVIIGNVIRRDNPELIEVLKKGIPYLSFPQAIKEILLPEKKSIVIAGTHGKTTTTVAIAWILEKAGLNPSFIAGGISKNFNSNFLYSSGKYIVIEGDEYDTAFFDKGPKFLHYNPSMAVLTGIEFDHADIYNSLEHVIMSFRRLIQLIPQDGIIFYNSDNSIAQVESLRSGLPTISYGFAPKADFYIRKFWYEGERLLFEVYKAGGMYKVFSTRLYGRHNLLNLLGAIAISDHLGISPETIYEAIYEFKGVRRRLDHLGEKDDILIIDDFAHHPTAVRETITAVKERFPERRLIAVFEPRSNSSRRKVFQKAYTFSFDRADIIMVPEPKMMDRIPKSERFSSKQLVEELRIKGKDAYYFSDTNKLLDAILEKIRRGDIILFMSNGIFDNLPKRLLDGLKNNN